MASAIESVSPRSKSALRLSLHQPRHRGRTGIRLARKRQVNLRVVPTGKAIAESVDLAHEMFNRVLGAGDDALQLSIMMDDVSEEGKE